MFFFFFAGISTLELTMKNHYHGEAYPFSNSYYDTESQVDIFLDLNQATAMAQFMVVLILKLVMSPKLPFSAPDYGSDIEQGIDHFMSKWGSLAKKIKKIKKQARKSILALNRDRNVM